MFEFIGFARGLDADEGDGAAADEDAFGAIEGEVEAVEVADGLPFFDVVDFDDKFVHSVLFVVLWVEADGSEGFFELGALGFEFGGEAEGFAEVGGIFVYGETGACGGDLEEDAAGFAEVDGGKVVSIEDGGRVELAGENFLASLQLGCGIGGGEGEVMDGTAAAEAA